MERLDVGWRADLTKLEQLERRGTGGPGKKNTQEEVDSDRSTRMNKMMLVRHQPGMPSFISFSPDFQLLIKPDSDGIYF